MIDFLKLTALIFLSALSVAVVAHPDLTLQIESLDIQLESNPTDSELLTKRGDLYRRHEDYPAAAKDFAAARKINPDNSLLDFYDAHLLFDSGEPEAAELSFKKYLGNHPQHAKAWALLGETSIHLKNPESAATYFANAIRYANSASPSLYRSRILSLLLVGQLRWDEASRVVDQGLQHFGLEVSLLGLGIDIALAGNQPQQAKKYLDQLPAALHSLPQWESRLTSVNCLTSGDPEISDPCWQQAMDNLSKTSSAFMAE